MQNMEESRDNSCDTGLTVKTLAAQRPACESSSARPGASTSRQMARWQKSSTARDAWQRVQGCSSIPQADQAGKDMWQGAGTFERGSAGTCKRWATAQVGRESVNPR